MNASRADPTPAVSILLVYVVLLGLYRTLPALAALRLPALRGQLTEHLGAGITPLWAHLVIVAVMTLAAVVLVWRDTSTAALFALVGAMYAAVRHTRPRVGSGGASDEAMLERLRDAGVRESSYEGPTTLQDSVTTEAEKLGMISAGVILQLPAYAQLERDYTGLYALLGYLDRLYGLGLTLDQLRVQSERQTEAIDENVAEDTRLKAWLTEMEAAYDAERSADGPAEDSKLSPELESFLRDVEGRLN